MSAAQKDLLKKLMLRKGSRSRLYAALGALTTGMFLLLVAVLLWWNFRQILEGRSGEDSLGSTFLTISKDVTDATMGLQGHSAFTEAEIESIRKAPQVQDAGALSPANFKVSASMGGQLNFYTLLFLEAAPDRFMDRKPAGWDWQPGSKTVPIILSREFLNMYNYVFAPSQGLPQLSENTVKALGFNLTVGEGSNQEEYRAQVEGFSDRIASVLVPASFVAYGNKTYGQGTVSPSRLILKVADPSHDAFVRFLKEHGYATNNEQLRWNRVRAIVQGVSAGTGLLALVLIGIGALVLVLFIELTMARAQESVRLLLQLGYSPSFLGKFMTRRFMPLLAASLLIALLLAVVAQAATALALQKQALHTSLLPGWPVWCAAALCGIVLYLRMKLAVTKAIRAV